MYLLHITGCFSLRKSQRATFRGGYLKYFRVKGGGRKTDLVTALYHYCRNIRYYPLCYYADLLIIKVFIAVIQAGKGWEH